MEQELRHKHDVFLTGVLTQLAVFVLSNTASLLINATMGSLVIFVTLYIDPTADAILTASIASSARPIRHAHITTFVSRRLRGVFSTEAKVTQVLVQRTTTVVCSKFKQGRSRAQF